MHRSAPHERDFGERRFAQAQDDIGCPQKILARSGNSRAGGGIGRIVKAAGQPRP